MAFVGSFVKIGDGRRDARRLCASAPRRTAGVMRVKLQSSALEHEEKQHRIAQRMDFWFSKANLKRDWYLKGKMNSEGWIPASVFLRFNTVKGLEVTEADVLEVASRVESVEVSMELRSVRSKFPPEELIRDREEEAMRTVFLTGLEMGTNSRMVKELVQNIAEPAYIHIGRSRDRRPKGWALMEFDDESMAQTFVDKYNDQRDDSDPVAVMQNDFVPTLPPNLDPSKQVYILHVTNIPGGLSFRNLLGLFKEFGGGYLNYNEDDNNGECLLRIVGDDAIMAFRDGRITIENSTLEASVLSQDESRLYWQIVEQRGARTTESEDGETGRVERILAKSFTALRKQISNFRPRVMDVMGIPADVSWPNAWRWLSSNDYGVRFLKKDDGANTGTLFFVTSEKMEAFQDYLDEGGMFVASPVSYRIWSVEEEQEHRVKLSKKQADD